jgi:hypothetical protein
LLVSYGKFDREDGKSLGLFFRISTDAGASFGPEREYRTSVRFIKGGLAGVLSKSNPGGGINIFYVISSNGGETWSEPVQINDEQGSVQWGFGGGLSFIQPSEDKIYCLWTDKRRGFLSLYFSASLDGGKTWTTNKEIEYDFREGEQTAPQLLEGENGRLIAIWVDWRDRQTLADIRCSYSDDGGKHWSASMKINDDNEHVWQYAVSAVAVGNNIYTAFSDFRDPGEDDDNDWNIYFARSLDNGKTWEKNIRLNDIEEGKDDMPHLAIDGQGKLYCVWQSCRESIFGQIAFSFSTDGGRSWSRSMRMDEGTELLSRNPFGSLAVSGGRLLCMWQKVGYDKKEFFLTRFEPILEPGPVKAWLPEIASEQIGEPSFGDEKILFAEEFSDDDRARWQETEGVWMIIGGTYMGVEPNSESNFSSFARFEEPESYILRGRFKLDPVAHHAAHLYFRANPAEDSYYSIVNQFRYGAWLGVRESGSSGEIINRNLLSRPLVERRFPFQKNRWYDFTLVVTPQRVDYYVDRRLILSYSGSLQLPPGRFGIGGGGPAPTYFDNIRIIQHDF